MFKKTEKKLLLYFPNLWNVKLIPALLFIIPANIVFWLLGYWLTNTTFAKANYIYFHSEDIALMTTISIFFAILCFIIWIFIYSRHNGFANLYPKKRGSLYVEWLMVAVVILGLALFPVSLTHGVICKWKHACSENTAKEELLFVKKMAMLIPDNSSNEFSFTDPTDRGFRYQYYDKNRNIPIPVEEKVNFEYGFLERKDFKFRDNRPTEFRGNSLLFYMPLYSSYENNYPYDDKEDSLFYARLKDEVNTMRDYLKNGDKSAIFNEIQKFDHILKKNGLTSNLEPEVWLDLIWNPPFFQLTNYNHISHERREYKYIELKRNVIHTYDTLTKIHYIIDTNYSVSYADTIMSGLTGRIERFFTDPYNYTDYNQLVTGYGKVIHAHHAKEDMRQYILIALAISLLLSVSLFSFRVTGGRAWLLSLMITGVLMIATIIFVILVDEIIRLPELQSLSIIYAIWGALFLFYFALFAIKIWKKKPRGKSAIYLNPLLWSHPFIFPAIYLIFIVYYDNKFNEYNIRHNTHLSYQPTIDVENMVWISVAILFVAMWFLTQWVKRWRSLPEE